MKAGIVSGLTELTQTLAQIKQTAEAESIHRGAIAAAEHMRDRIIAEAPQGPTGNLKRSIESGGFKKRKGKPVAAFVRVNRKIAPHAHLVEFSAREGNMPANPFFTRGFNTSREAAVKILEEHVGKAIDDAIK